MSVCTGVLRALAATHTLAMYDNPISGLFAVYKPTSNMRVVMTGTVADGINSMANLVNLFAFYMPLSGTLPGTARSCSSI